MSIYSQSWLLIAIFISTMTTVLADSVTPASHHVDEMVVSPNLQLKDVLEKTFARSPQQAKLLSQQSVLDARNQVASAMLPSTPSLTIGHQNDTVGSGRGEREWQAEVELPVWRPNQRQNRLKVADAFKSSLITSQESLKLQVAGTLRDALWDIAFNDNNVALASNKLEVSQRLQADVEKRFKAGELAKTDAIFAQQETLRAEKEKLRADAELMHARHRYFVLTGLREMPANIQEKQSSLEDYSQSPIWLEAQSKLGLAETERQLANIESRDNFQVLISTRRIQGGFDTTFNDSVGLKIRIPFGGDARAATIKSASELNLGNALSEQETLRLSLETAMHEAEHNLSVSQAELGIASKQFDMAKESVRLAKKAFQLGETDLVSLLRVQAQTNEIERAFTSRQIQLQWDIARYNQAVGVLP
ncbi:MAG: TolC family protein [Pseudomonadota bacterium]